MEPPRSDVPKLPDMVMCGDHPSFTKTELNLKMDEKEKEKEKQKTHISRTKLSPTSSGTGRAISEHTMPPARRRPLELEAPPCRAPPTDGTAPPSRALLQAALGSFRWPPYLLCVWVLVLVLTHALHCLCAVLERTLPTVRKFCHYFRSWTEETWKCESDMNHRLCPVGLALLTGVLYTLYFGLYVAYSVTVWAIEPLCTEFDDKPSDEMEPKITNYIDEVNSSKTNSSFKQ